MRKTADVVVIGGGVIGCAAAAELAAAGAGVVLLERREIAAGASGRNHGLAFYPQSPVTGPLFDESMRVYRDLAGNSPLRFLHDETPRGFVLVVAAADEWPAADREAAQVAEGGIDVHRLDERSLYEAEPGLARGLLGGYLIDDGYRLDPAALTLALAEAARGSGAEVLTHTEVKQVVLRKGRVAGVSTDAGVVEAGVVVDAAGPWSPKVARSAGADLPVTGARGWLVLTRAAGPLTNHLVESAGWHLTAGEPGPGEVGLDDYANSEVPPAADIGLIVQQNPSGHVLLGGSRLASLRDDPEGHEATVEIARRAVRMLPALAGVPVAGTWSGVRPVSPDGLPLIGWMPGVEGFFVATGHGGQGVMLGGGSGRLVAQVVTGSEPFCDPAPFDPARF